MRVLVVSEGRHELALDRDTGPLVELLRRLLQGQSEFERRKVSDPVVRTHVSRGKAENYEKRALAWVSFAQKNGFDALVLLIDQDGDRDRQIGIENAQSHVRFTLPRALGIAIRTFDAWMLADEKALAKALGCRVQRQKAPEGIDDPKDTCQALHAGSGCVPSLTEVYQTVAATLDIETLAKRCPQGFPPFRQRVERLSQRP